MTNTEREQLISLANTLHIGEYTTLVWRGSLIGGTVRWVHNHGFSLDLGMPQAWRALLGWHDSSPRSTATFEW